MKWIECIMWVIPIISIVVFILGLKKSKFKIKTPLLILAILYIFVNGYYSLSISAMMVFISMGTPILLKTLVTLILVSSLTWLSALSLLVKDKENKEKAKLFVRSNILVTLLIIIFVIFNH